MKKCTVESHKALRVEGWAEGTVNARIDPYALPLDEEVLEYAECKACGSTIARIAQEGK